MPIPAPDFAPYVLPGVLWWSFDRASALAQVALSRAGSGSIGEAGEYTSGKGAVVLLDEIDKADPDVPNNPSQIVTTPQDPSLLAHYNFHG